MVCQEFQTRLCREMSFPNSSPAKAPSQRPAPPGDPAPQVTHAATGDAAGDGADAMDIVGEPENADTDVSMEARGQDDDGRDGGPHDQDLVSFIGLLRSSSPLIRIVMNREPLAKTPSPL